ncbi:MAG: hypothetical protein HC880_02580 [Bacteroidia bacterium]|nr:hypothetical protein [Bacteroidia bacterium]
MRTARRLSIVNNGQLKSLEGLEKITEVSSLRIEQNPQLLNLHSLSGLSKARSLTITANNALMSLEGLENLEEVTEDLFILENTQLKDLSGLGKLSRVGRSLRIEGNSQLTNLLGLNSLTQISYLIVDNNAQLLSLTGLENTTFKDLLIGRNAQLENLSGLGNLNDLNVLIILNNARLRSLEGLNTLQKVTSWLEIRDNPALPSMRGLESLQTVRELRIINNDNLVSLKGLENLMEVIFKGEITNNSSLNNCCAIQSLLNLNPNQVLRIGNNAPGCFSVSNVNTFCAGLSDIAVTDFRLIDAQNDQVIRILQNNDIIDLQTLGSTQLSIEALVSSDQVKSVRWILSGTINHQKLENVVPYSLFGNLGADFSGQPLKPGIYQIQAIPYAEKNGQGSAGRPWIINFQVIDGEALIIKSFTLINADTDQEIGPLNDGDTINTTEVGRYLTFVAQVDTSVEVKSMIFFLNNVRTNVEVVAPYALYGNQGNDYFGRNNFNPGRYTLKAIAYSETFGQGQSLDTLSITFTVISQASAVVSASASQLYQNAPNPSQRQTTIQAYLAPTVREARLLLYDGQGTLLREISLPQRGEVSTALTTENLKPGLYFYKLMADGKEVAVRRMLVEE